MSMSLHSWTEDVALSGGARPAGLGFSQFRLIFGILSPETTTHPKLVALVRN